MEEIYSKGKFNVENVLWTETFFGGEVLIENFCGETLLEGNLL